MTLYSLQAHLNLSSVLVRILPVGKCGDTTRTVFKLTPRFSNKRKPRYLISFFCVMCVQGNRKGENTT